MLDSGFSRQVITISASGLNDFREFMLERMAVLPPQLPGFSVSLNPPNCNLAIHRVNIRGDALPAEHFCRKHRCSRMGEEVKHGVTGHGTGTNDPIDAF